MDNFHTILAEHERALREVLKDNVTDEALSCMTLGNQRLWNSDGFYSALSTLELVRAGVPVSEEEIAFPIPEDCPYWGQAQRKDDLVLRAMLRQSWVDIPNPEHRTELLLIVCGAADPTLITSTTLTSGTEELHLTRKEYSNGRTLLFWKGASTVLAERLTITCKMSGVSSTWGRFSLVVAKPVWI
jgi:hypothetical protein